MQINLDTKDVFIEVTATDLTKAQVVLNTVCTMFCEYCSTPFEVEPVEVIDSFGDRKRKQPFLMLATGLSWFTHRTFSRRRAGKLLHSKFDMP